MMITVLDTNSPYGLKVTAVLAVVGK
jgi:hypothetical protein